MRVTTLAVVLLVLGVMHLGQVFYAQGSEVLAIIFGIGAIAIAALCAHVGGYEMGFDLGYRLGKKQDEHERWPLSRVQQFVGFLSADVPELHAVEMPRLAASIDRFTAALSRKVSV